MGSSYETQAAYASSQATKTKVTSTAQECSNWITEADISDSQKEIYLNNLSRNTHGSMPSRSLDELSKDTSLHLSSRAVESMQVVEGAQVSCMKGMTRDMLVSTSSGGPKVGGKPGLTIKDTETVLGTFGTCKKQRMRRKKQKTKEKMHQIQSHVNQILKMNGIMEMLRQSLWTKEHCINCVC
ncbi:hypothetical protein IW492_17415 [Enterococcus sp. BWB1-3]|uniref:hypothetical protein n=1 Tax=Enterococcus sp. BWB1-3 TaxID=2787713 RepID=UPI001923279F|nr:hypothetical protein [Enterococcus sp. BWB1-3]MBL1231006.1 hypothetical protein [Enterococcus sp. BWB1-3]